MFREDEGVCQRINACVGAWSTTGQLGVKYFLPHSFSLTNYPACLLIKAKQILLFIRSICLNEHADIPKILIPSSNVIKLCL